MADKSPKQQAKGFLRTHRDKAAKNPSPENNDRAAMAKAKVVAVRRKMTW